MLFIMAEACAYLDELGHRSAVQHALDLAHRAGGDVAQSPARLGKRNNEK